MPWDIYSRLLCVSLILAIVIFIGVLGGSCTYYGAGRLSAPENNLANCSWFGRNACCKRTEVTSVFAEMYKLYGATKECEDRMSYLMCYFCSPDQEIWFRDNKKATICRSFCDSVFEHCQDAWIENNMLRDVFTDKTLLDGGLCKDNFFDVVDGEKDCYKFDPAPFSGQNRLISTPLLLTSLIFGVLQLIYHDDNR